MSVSTSVELEWGGAKRKFALPNAQAFELEKETGAGIVLLNARLRAGAWLLSDLRNILRRALMGGGLTAPEADKLLVEYFDDERIPRQPQATTCLLITSAWLYGVEAAAEGNGAGEVTA